MRRPLIVIATTAFAIVACSGATGSDDLFNGSGFGSSGSSGSSGGSGSSGASGTSGGSGSSSGGSSSGGSSSGGSSSGGSSSGGSSSGVVDAGHKDATAGDPGIFCGGTGKGGYCIVGSQVCCAGGGGNTGLPPTYSCQVDTTPCDGVPVGCDDTADCGTQKCCGEFNASTGYVSVACRASCDGTAANGDTFVQLCDKAVAGTCPAGLTCQASGSLVGFSICK